MAHLDEQGGPEPPLAADGTATLLCFFGVPALAPGVEVRGTGRARLRATVAASSTTLGGLLKHLAYGGGLEQRARRTWPDRELRSLRGILVHMIAEYARHNRHADLLRESVDGLTVGVAPTVSAGSRVGAEGLEPPTSAV
jgi:hypothetical protein